jgi:lipopolysaccharide/colanic/teichoic acid biosynthesis glycosyltransferase
MQPEQLRLLSPPVEAIPHRPRIFPLFYSHSSSAVQGNGASVLSEPSAGMFDWPSTRNVGTWAKDRPLYFFCKRLLDFVLACLALTFLAPLMGIITLLIKWDSPGGVIFAQERVGARRRAVQGKIEWQRCTFTCYKFRSMRVNADAELHRRFVEAYIAGDENGMAAAQPEKQGEQRYKLNGDPRITRVGRFLRKTSLDELPQLWNVLKGEMSLVGPRPPIPYEVAMYSDRHLQRLQTIPGMTGLWQVKGRGELGFEEMVNLDLEYIQTQSFWQDVRILLGTIPAVLLNKGAA